MKGYRVLLRLLYDANLSNSCLAALFSGYLGSVERSKASASVPIRNTSAEPMHTVSVQDRWTLLALRKLLLRWCAKRLQESVRSCQVPLPEQAKATSSEVELSSPNRMVAYLLSLLCDEVATSGEEIAGIVHNLGVPACVLALSKRLTPDAELATPTVPTLSAIFDEGIPQQGGARGETSSSPMAAPLTGMEAAALMKLGVRVVRGPDWKWGDQVITATGM